MTFFTDLAADAQDLLAEFGEDVIIKRTAPASYDPTTRQTTPGGDLQQTVRGTFESGSNRALPDSLTVTYERSLTAVPSLLIGAFDLAPGDIAIGDGGTWTVGAVTIERRQGVVLLYIAGLTRR